MKEMIFLHGFLKTIVLIHIHHTKKPAIIKKINRIKLQQETEITEITEIKIPIIKQKKKMKKMKQTKKMMILIMNLIMKSKIFWRKCLRIPHKKK